MTNPFRKAGALARFLLYFNYELVLANLRVAADVMRPVDRLHPRIIAVPVDLTGEFQVALLANMVTLTPGSLTLHISDDRRTLYVHAMNVKDIDALRHQIRSGFERYVRDLFA